MTTPARGRRDRGDDGHRLRRPRPDRLSRLPARLALVRPPDRRRRGADRPHPRPLPLQRAARLRRPPLHRPLPGRAADRDAPPAGGLAGPRPARPRRTAAAGGLALLLRLLRLAGADARAQRPLISHASARRLAPALAKRALAAGARLAGSAGPCRPTRLGGLRLDHLRQPHLLLHRDPRNGRNPRTPDRPGRPRSLRAAPARRGAAVAGDGRRLRRRRPRPRLPAPAQRGRGRRRGARARRLRRPRLRRAGDHAPLHDARRRGPGRLRRARAARLAPARARPPLAAAPGRRSPRSSR